ncbi:MAG: cytochrome C [Magnetococcales bacterium]|nr:cytochrome C [Magnetococcales bacterium]
MSYPSLCIRFLFFVLPVVAGLLWVVPDVARAADHERGGGAEHHLQLELPKDKTACVKPTEWMRRNHMDFLKHNRDLAVREGIRTKDDSLKNCTTCHTSREKFCDRCHAYTGIEPNCFECHHYPK